jgi:hypothetical protein
LRRISFSHKKYQGKFSLAMQTPAKTMTVLISRFQDGSRRKPCCFHRFKSCRCP